MPTYVVGPNEGAVQVVGATGTAAAGAAPIAAGGVQVITTASFTRPADTTAYTAFDVVSNSTTSPSLLTFSGAARANGGSGLIVSARHMKSSTGTSGATYRLHLYRVGTITPINDNAQHAMLYANRANRIGFIDFNHVGSGTGTDSTGALTTFVNLPFVCDAAQSSLWGALVVTSAYTPTSGEQHFIELAIAQN